MTDTSPSGKKQKLPTSAETFKDLFNKDIRPVQENFIKDLDNAINTRESLLGQLPTGTGKSLVAFYACHKAQSCTSVFEETSNNGGKMYNKSVIIASSIDLQFQYLQDAIVHQHSIGSSLVLLGKNNYLCTKRLNNELSTLIPFDSNPVAKQYFTDLKNECCKFPSSQSKMWQSSMRNNWFEYALSNGIGDKEAEQFWSRVCANDECDCRSTAWMAAKAQKSSCTLHDVLDICVCPCARSRLLAKAVDIIILNTAYACTMASAGMLRSYIGDRFVVFDEAHLLPGDAQSIYDACSETKLLARQGTTILKKWKDKKAPIASNIKVDFGVFDRAFYTEEREMLVWSNNDIVNEFKKAVVEYDESAHKAVYAWAKEAENNVSKEVARYVLPQTLKQIEEFSSLDGKFKFSREEVEASGVRLGSISSTDDDAYIRTMDCIRSKFFSNYGFTSQTSEEKIIYDSIVAIASHPLSGFTPKKFINEHDEIWKFIKSIKAAKMACSGKEWRDSANIYRDQCPIAHKNGIRFELTAQQKAYALNMRLFGSLPSQPIMMSATMTDENLSFDIFEALVGRKFTIKKTYESPFDKTKRTFIVPEDAIMPKSQSLYNSNASTQDRMAAQAKMEQWRNKRYEYIQTCIEENTKKITLVIGPSYDDLSKVQDFLSLKFPNHAHVDFSKKFQLQAFENNDTNGIIYGSKKLATGVNYPGKIGLVVILKSINKALSVAELYSKQFLMEDPMPFYNWERVNMFMQASGRLIRCDTDEGKILFFNTEGSSMELAAIKNVFGVTPKSSI